MDNNYKIALLIDAENVPPVKIPLVMKEMAKYGIAITSRFYGDITNISKEWAKIAADFSIRPIHQYNVATRKNAADMAMGLDALDIMNQGLVNMFMVVTSDADFTPLIIKLRERGALVIGIGDKKASRAFVNSCNEFKYFDYLGDDEDKLSDNDNTKEISPIIRSIIVENGSKGKIMLSNLGNLLLNMHSDFDPRKYGAKNLSNLIVAMKDLRLIEENDKLYVTIVEGISKDDIAAFIMNKLEKAQKPIALPELKQDLQKKFPSFKIQDYGYNKFGKFIDSLPNLETVKNTVSISKKNKGE